MQSQRSTASSYRLLADYVQSLEDEMKKLSDDIRIAQDTEFRRTLQMRFTLKQQLVMDLQRCIGLM